MHIILIIMFAVLILFMWCSLKLASISDDELQKSRIENYSNRRKS